MYSGCTRVDLSRHGVRRRAALGSYRLTEIFAKRGDLEAVISVQNVAACPQSKSALWIVLLKVAQH